MCELSSGTVLTRFSIDAIPAAMTEGPADGATGNTVLVDVANGPAIGKEPGNRGAKGANGMDALELLGVKVCRWTGPNDVSGPACPILAFILRIISTLNVAL